MSNWKNGFKYGGIGLLMLGGGALVDLCVCAEKLTRPVSYPDTSSVSFDVGYFTGSRDGQKTLIGKGKNAQGQYIEAAGNVVIAQDDNVYFASKGPIMNTLAWEAAGLVSLVSDDADAGQFVLNRTASGWLGASAEEITRFDKSGQSTSSTAYFVLGMKWPRGEQTAERDEYNYGTASEALNTALRNLADAMTEEFKKEKQDKKDSINARMSKLFVSKFSNMEPTANLSVLSDVTPTRENMKRQDGYLEMRTDTVSVRLYNDGVVENIESFGNGEKRISVLVQPEGIVTVTHDLIHKQGRNFSFTHIMLKNGEILASAASSNAKTGEQNDSVSLKYPMQTPEQIKVLGAAALNKAITMKRFQMDHDAKAYKVFAANNGFK